MDNISGQLASTPIDKFRHRADGQREWLDKHAPECFTEQKHTTEMDGAPCTERIYWHYGYMVALRDVVAMLERTTANGN